MRPWLVWMLFAICLSVVLSAMGWASLTVLRLDRAEAAARQHAELEENVRLALWRMDSALAPIIARENTWPYFAYTSFYPAQRAYTNMLLPVHQGEILVPSPLLSHSSPHVLLHFQIGPDARFTSPQVPTDRFRDLAEEGHTTSEAITDAAERLRVLEAALGRDVLTLHLPPPQARDVRAVALPTDPAQPTSHPGSPRSHTADPQYDLGQRQARQQQQFVLNQMAQSVTQSSKTPTEYPLRQYNLQHNTLNYADPISSEPVSDVQEGMGRPLWLNGHLLLARRVVVRGSEYIQGCWLDWPALETLLRHSIADLFPESRLEIISGEYAPGNGDRVLAALPVRLIPGVPAVYSDGLWSPLRLSLLVAWGCMLVAAAAVAVLLAGALSLSERRGSFVSAVTHEMRTPLTTFRMYTEMLVKGMVPAERRAKYLDTLRIEADRLSHLVENVLAYARLERGKLSSRLEAIAPSAIVTRSRGRLADRAEQAGMQLTVEEGIAGDEPMVLADPTAVEQILFNLVDNASKYATTAADKTIRLGVREADGAVLLEVSDGGPGIPFHQQRSLFRPFSKSAHQAAHSAPGVGLGLALSRRLARSMGGELTYRGTDGQGARFVLALPITER